MSQQQINEIEFSIQQAQAFIKLGKCIERLEVNADFQELIADSYFKDEAIRLVHLKGDHTQQSDEAQKEIDNQMLAISGLSSYFRIVQMRAEMAVRAVTDDEDTLAELHAEALN
tara:strand:+ start:4289 stop:4630 length:342 start_codon:yes stop_codon:yes gene_type:complete